MWLARNFTLQIFAGTTALHFPKFIIKSKQAGSKKEPFIYNIMFVHAGVLTVILYCTVSHISVCEMIYSIYINAYLWGGSEGVNLVHEAEGLRTFFRSHGNFT